MGDENKIIDIIKKGNIILCDYRDSNIPEVLANKKIGKVDKFSAWDRGQDKSVSLFFKTRDLYFHNIDVCFLDNKGLKIMLTCFPYQCQYFLMRVAFRKSWLLALPGLLRRVSKKQIKIKNIITLKASNKKQRWLFVENIELHSIGGRRGYLSEKVGVQRFLDFLRKEKIRYVVLRFYEKLPNLYREGGDLDLLVEDEDEIKINSFLDNNPGRIRIGIHSVSWPNYRQMTCYPPHLARSIINNAINGPAGSRIPNPREAFLSFAYHALYHKGFYSGVPTTLKGVKTNPFPENNYTGILESMAKNLGINIPINMESLDEYLHQEGWRPKLDTLSRFGPENEWILQKFFTDKNRKEIGLGCFVLKEGAVKLNLVEEMISAIEREHFSIIAIKFFNSIEKEYVSEQLRGGYWSRGKHLDENFLPAVIVVVIDTLFKESNNYKIIRSRIRNIKEKLRARFDTERESLIHGTDGAHESWEYIKVCFPDQIEEIRERINQVKPFCGFFYPFKKIIIIFKTKIYYYKSMIKIKIFNFLKKLVIS